MTFRNVAALLAALSAVAAAPALRAADKAPAYTTLAEAGDDYFFQGEYVGNSTTHGRVGLQVIAEGDGALRGVLRIGGLPGEGWNGGASPEFAGRREAGSGVLEGSDGTLLLQVGTAVWRDAAKRQLGVLRRVDRKSTTLGRRPPQGAVVLFDGTSTDRFVDAKISPAGNLMHGALTNFPVRDFDMHLEFRLPFMPAARGQARANSGVYIQRRYEVQILDSFGLKGEPNECAGLYKTKSPDVNMCLPPLAWQTYDIEFRAARFDASGNKVSPARITVNHNGFPVQRNFAIPNKTGGGQPEGPQPLPILLQDHGNPVEYRNVWLVER
jgi:hypothetical protein